MKLLCILLFFFTLLFNIQSLAQAQSPKYEFRAVWIATVENIDWPSKKGLSVAQQKSEFIQLLELHKRNGMNAIIMQIRPASDAFYPSQYEPWSEYLTGKQGLPPTPYYDPLQFMIEETHKRGMEFHAWLNPYRAVFNVKKSSVSPTHITRIQPSWFVTYGDKKYFNPGIPEAQQFVTRIVKDLIIRYDLDGIHMDDYFYPYRIAGKEFPDEASYKKFGNGMTKDEWRRSNCDSIIKAIHETVVAHNPTVRFGVSPFGVWRNQKDDPEGSNTNAGQTNYDDLYADILLWLKKGWIDYVAPQLYWEFGHKLVDYQTLLDWWAAHGYGKHIYIGHGIYRAGSSEAWKNTDEIPAQISALREKENIQGSIYFSSKTFEKNPNGWNDSLRYNYYNKPAIVPPMNWIDTTKPPKPVINHALMRYDGNKLRIGIKEKDADVKNYAIYHSEQNNIDIKNAQYLLAIVPASVIETTTISLPEYDKKINRYLKITAISRTNVESEPEELLLLK